MPTMDDAPTHLGRYRIECVLGRGAMGVVYLAFDPHIEREVALKTIRSELLQPSAEGLTTQDLRLRFLNEARAPGPPLTPVPTCFPRLSSCMKCSAACARSSARRAKSCSRS